jgi:hypothetical protein
MDLEALDCLREAVVDDDHLRSQLLSARDRVGFIAKVVEIAQSRGFELSADEVSEALRDERRQRYERWV